MTFPVRTLKNGVAAAALGLCLAVVPAYAQSPKPAAASAETAPRIMVLDFEGVMANSEAARSVREQLEKHRAAFQAEISKEEEKLRNEEQELSRQRTILSADAMAKKQQEFEKKVVGLQRSVQMRKRQLDLALAHSMGQVQAALIQIADELATQRNANVVLRKAAVVLVAKDMDVSQEALALLNKKLPAVKVTIPKIDASGEEVGQGPGSKTKHKK